MFIAKKNKNCLRKHLVFSHKVEKDDVKELIADTPVVEEVKEIKKRTQKPKKEAEEINNEVEKA